jgi:hypothetical protein
VRTRVDSRGLASWRKRQQFQALRARNRVMSLCCKLRLKGVRLPPPPPFASSAFGRSGLAGARSRPLKDYSELESFNDLATPAASTICQ